MDWDELVDRYKNTKIWIRMLIIVFAAIVIPAFTFFDEGETLTLQLEETRATRDALKAKIDRAVNSSSELPELERRVAQIEQGLEKARRFLPPSIEFDEILSATGMLEKELGVQVMKFVPGTETQPNPDIRYAEVPVEITVKADFGRVMQFFDRLVHMEKLTHLRNISFESAVKDGEAFTDPAATDGAGGRKDPPGTVIAKASLILFRDVG